jgi:hypothetical protein
MAESPLIFVSHSSLDQDLTREVCAQLDAAAGTPYRSLVDYDALEGGQDWPLYLIEFMVRCHSAVILLTERAIASPWVLKEATILTARRSLDPSFKLFIVRFPNTEQLLETPLWRPLFLGNIQQLTYLDAQGVATDVHGVLGNNVSVETPFEQLVDTLADLLERATPRALKAASGKLNVVPAKLTIASNERMQWVENIARHLVCGHLGQFGGIPDLIDQFNASDVETVRKILRILSPYWIEALAAARLLRLLGSQERWAAAMNGADVAAFTAPLYVRRAHQPSLKYDIIPIAGGAADKFVEDVSRQICNFLDRSRPRRQSDKQVIAQLAGQPAEWYAVLPPPMPDAGAIEELLNLFPTITFILWTGEALPGDRSLPRVEWLEPPVDLDRESKELGDLERAERILERMTS